MIAFEVPGQPVGKGRPRIGRVGGYARMFTPEKTISYESTVALFASQAMSGSELLIGPVRALMKLTMAIPESWSKKKKEMASAGLIRPTTKPDVDNVIKAIFDAVNGVVWRDDVQVVELQVTKFYGIKPGVSVSVEEIALDGSSFEPKDCV